MNDLTVSQIIAQLRAKATILNNQADALERAWGEHLPMETTPQPEAEPNHGNANGILADEIRALVRTDKVRIKEAARRLGYTEEMVYVIVNDPANGISNKNRGWLRLTGKAH